MNNLVRELRKMKEASRLTTKQLSDISGVPESTVQRIMTGETANPTMQNVADLVSAMGGSLDELYSIKVSAPKKESDSQTMCHSVCAKRMADITALHERELENEKKHYEKEIGRLTKWLIFVTAAFISLVVGVLVFTTIDIVKGDVGWIRYDEFARIFAHDTTYLNSLVSAAKDMMGGIFGAKL